jgi:hypothetical protein
LSIIQHWRMIGVANETHGRKNLMPGGDSGLDRILELLDEMECRLKDSLRENERRMEQLRGEQAWRREEAERCRIKYNLPPVLVRESDGSLSRI